MNKTGKTNWQKHKTINMQEMEQTLELNAAKKTIHIFTKAAKRNKKVKKSS